MGEPVDWIALPVSEEVEAKGGEASMGDSVNRFGIRSATEQDLPDILGIYNHAVLHSVATADYEPQTLEARSVWYTERTKAGFPIFVAEERTSGEVVGWSAYGPYHNRYGYRFTVENSVYVSNDWRGQGIGKLLLPPLVEHATAGGYHSIIASIDGSNTASIRLHAAFGFEEVGRIREIVYKFDRWLDVVYMQRMLGERAPA